MATYPPMSNDQRDAVTMLHPRDSHQQISYSEARTIIPENSSMHTNFVSSNPNISRTEETLFNFNNGSQFLMHSVDANSNVFERAQGHQGLSLSLGTHVVNPMLQVSNAQFHNDHSILGGNNNNATTTLAPNGDKDATTSYTSHMGRIDVGSKYLKAAQELLEEVVSAKKDFSSAKNVRTESMEDNARGNNSNCELMDANLSESSTKAGTSELSSAEKQEVQNKLTKLLWMLDEVDRRYRQYYHQMHIVVSSFDAISGSGSAKPYTSLALQTISRHFRTLRDAINGQIHHARKSLVVGGGEDYSSCSNDKGGIGISRLRYVDQQIRQQKVLQQLGMMQPHTWRPQRGLPEASVTILRAWLFEHFLHPYPKDSDKVMLARQTGLTRSQVSNWFINARVRLWKPMIEEMYREEEEAAANVDADMDSNSSSDNIITRATVDDSITREDRRTQQSMATSTSPSSSTMLRCDSSKANHARDMATINRSDNFINPALQNSVQTGPSNCGYYMEQRNESNEPISILPDAMILQSNSHRFFGGYDVPDQLKRLGDVSGVSLTLGLQHEYEGGGGGGGGGSGGNNVADMVTEGFVQVRGNNNSNSNDAYNNTASFSYGGS